MVLAGEGRLIKHLACFTRDKSGITIDTGDEAATVSRDRETGKWEELGGDGMSWHLVRALESDNGWNHSNTQVRNFQVLHAHSVLCTGLPVLSSYCNNIVTPLIELSQSE
jgi:hypothetical protein